ncbi:MAG: hypothetical protein NZ551_00610 [Microscillaceae bacterium]|nr:hypothetical protein [Microscillaceae bacterium]MDW8459689.1 OstA-like protein [Cytophagales bacterium]
MSRYKFFLSFLAIFFHLFLTFAQNTIEKVEIMPGTGELEGRIINHQSIKILKKNVIIRHKNIYLYCDSANLYEDRNTVDAYGNARLVDENGTTLTSQSMFYDGNAEFAKATGNVVMTDSKMTLYTQEVKYNLITGIATYETGGRIIDEESTLTSQIGIYDTKSKVFYFTQNVVLVSNKENQKIEAQELTYHTTTKLATFKGKTKITSKDGVIYTERGTYNTESKVSVFDTRTTIETEKYTLTGDSVWFDNSQKIGFAKGNTELIAKKDSLIINGEVGTFNDQTGFSKVFGNALLRSISQRDTLFLTADTLLSVSNKKNDTKTLYAYPKVQIFHKEFQARCDSLVYQTADSTLYFYQDPVLWNAKSQLSADTIWMHLEKQKIKQMHLRVNAFAITLDTLNQFNQMKGKRMIANFHNNEIRRIDVIGNAESIYFVLEGDTALIGMNRAECSDIVIRFKEKNQLAFVTYIGKPDAKFIPPHEIQEPETKLKNFRWRMSERPDKATILLRLQRKENLKKKT